MAEAAFPEVDDIFNRFLALRPVPGLSYAVVRGGAVVHFRGFGERCIRTSAPVTENTRFRIASMTKSFAAAATLLLRDEGHLRLCESVRKVLPDLEVSEFLGTRTVYQLLSMTGDLPTDDPWGDRQLGSSDLEYGTQYNVAYSAAGAGEGVCSYSNLGYMLLGRIISSVSGQHAHDFVRSRLLEPLGMYNTAWNADGTGDFAEGYRPDGNVWRELESVPCRGDGDVFAGLWTTPADLARWVRFFTSSWESRTADQADAILSRESRRTLQLEVAHMPDRFFVPWKQNSLQRQRSRYCLGLIGHQAGDHCFIGHSGGLPGFGSHMRWHKHSDLGVIALANRTYAEVTHPVMLALDFLVRSEARSLFGREIPQAIERCGEMLLSLLKEWDEDTAQKLFTSNVFQDIEPAELKQQCSRAGRTVGADLDNASITQLEALKGQLRWERPQPVAVEFLLSPHASARIQKVTFFVSDPHDRRRLWVEALRELFAGGCGSKFDPEHQELLLAVRATLGDSITVQAVHAVSDLELKVKLSGPFGTATLRLFSDAAGELVHIEAE